MGTIRIDFGSRGGARATRQLRDFNVQLANTIDLSGRLGSASGGDPFKSVGDSAQRARRQVRSTEQQTRQFGSTLNAVISGFSAAGGFAVIQGLTQAFRQGFNAINGIIQESIAQFSAFEARLIEFDAKSGDAQVSIESLASEAQRLAAVTSQTPATVAALATQLLTLGVAAEDVEGSLGGITKLSDVIGSDPVLTGQIVQAGVANFRSFGESTDSIADKIANLQNSSAAGATGITEFQFLLQQAGAVANTAGVSFDELGASFAVLREGGIRARPAATALRNAILALGAPTDKAAQELEAIGVEAFDAEGNFKGLGTVIEDFAQVAQGLSVEEQLRISTILFGRQGAPAILQSLNEIGGTYERVLNDVQRSNGEVDRTLDEINQSLERQAEILQGKVAAAFTELGAILAPVARLGVGTLNNLADASIALLQGFQALPAPLQAAVIGITGFTAALGAAVAALTLYNAVNGTAIAQAGALLAATLKKNVALSVETIRVTAARAAWTAYAVATNTATAAQVAQTRAVIAGAAKLGLFAAALGSVILVADTFSQVTEASDQLNESLDEINDLMIDIQKSTENIPPEIFGEEAQNNVEQLKEELGAVQGFLDGIRGAIPGLSTAAEASTNRTKVAFAELSTGIGEVEEQSRDVIRSLQSGAEVSEQEFSKTNRAIQASIAALQQARPVTEADIQVRDAQIARLERYQELLVELNRQGLSTPATPELDGESLELQTQELERQGQQELFDRQQQFDRKKFQRDQQNEQELADFKEERQVEIDESRRQVELELNQLKFDGEAAIEDLKRANEDALQQKREQRLQSVQATERQFNDAERQAEEQFNAEQRRLDEQAQERIQRLEQDVDDQLALEFAANPRERRDLRRQQAERDARAEREAELRREAGIDRIEQQRQQQREQAEQKFEANKLQRELANEQIIAAAKQEIEADIENRKLEFERNVLQPEKVALEAQLAQARAKLLAPVLEAERQLENEIAELKFQNQQAEQARARDFEAKQKAFEENYKTEIRNADIAASETVAANIEQGAENARATLESTNVRISGAQSGGANNIQSFRRGGVMQPYSVADVHDGEWIKVHGNQRIATGSNYATVVSQTRSRMIDSAAMIQARQSAATNQRTMQAMANEIKGLRADLAKRGPARLDQVNYNYTNAPRMESDPLGLDVRY